MQFFQVVDDGVLHFSRKVTLKDGDEEQVYFAGDSDEVRELVDGIVFSQAAICPTRARPGPTAVRSAT